MLTKTVSLYDVEGKSIGTFSLPVFFEAPIRTDLIRRAVVAIQSHSFQPQGRDPMAGKRTTAESLGVGRGMSRIPRVKGERYARGGMAGFAAGTVKGRLTFPPTSTKIPAKKINKKELRAAMLSAVAATSSKPLVRARGHRIPDDLELPLIVSDAAEKITKNAEAEKILKNLGVWDDIERAAERKIRSGKGSVRGRPYKSHVSALIIVSKRQGAERAFGNFSGVGVVDVSTLNVSDLAPGTHPGRLTIWTESAIKGLETRLGGASA
jgi:large subunit ribosomal protein L4e